MSAVQKDPIWDKYEIPFLHRAMAVMVRDKKFISWDTIMNTLTLEEMDLLEAVSNDFFGFIEITEEGVYWKGENHNDAEPEEIELLKVLQIIPEYPYDYPLDLVQIREWKRQFSDVDLLVEINNFQNWLRKNSKHLRKRNIDYRIKLTNWLKKVTGRIKTIETNNEKSVIWEFDLGKTCKCCGKKLGYKEIKTQNLGKVFIPESCSCQST